MYTGRHGRNYLTHYEMIKRLLHITIALVAVNIILTVGFAVKDAWASSHVEAQSLNTVEVFQPETPAYNPEDLGYLACVIYQEAGGDSCCDDCRRRVADVVLNRVNDDRFPNDIYSVLTQPKQYGRFAQTGVVWPDRADNPGEVEAVDRAYRIAEEVLTGQHSELYDEGYIWQAEFKQGTDIVECCDIYFGR